MRVGAQQAQFYQANPIGTAVAILAWAVASARHTTQASRHTAPIQDDTVAITDEGVRVNGQLLSHSAPLNADEARRPMPRYRPNAFTLGASEVLLMSDASATSFDGRYFGPLSRSQIKSVIHPVLTWK